MRQEVRLERKEKDGGDGGSSAEALPGLQEDQAAQYDAEQDGHETGAIEKPIGIVVDVKETMGDAVLQRRRPAGRTGGSSAAIGAAVSDRRRGGNDVRV